MNKQEVPLLPSPDRRTLAQAALRLGVAGLCVPLSAPLWAAQATALRELRIIATADSTSARQLVQQLRQRFPAAIVDADPAALEARHGPAVYIAVGAPSLLRARQQDIRHPVVSIMISSQTWRQIMAADANTARDRSNFTAIYADAPPAAQMQLISALFDGNRTVGALLSSSTAHLDKPLRQAASQFNIDLITDYATPSAELARALTRLRGAQVLLAVPDSTLYTPDTLRSVLEATYRNGMPVIGFSAATVAAGTLATAHCVIDDMVADLSDLLEDIGSSSTPEPRFPRYWRVAVNDSVARSLGIAIDERIRQLGNRPRGATP
jgi:putative tryptophan/tyrosine transport system substrate-binding protein